MCVESSNLSYFDLISIIAVQKIRGNCFCTPITINNRVYNLCCVCLICSRIFHSRKHALIGSLKVVGLQNLITQQIRTKRNLKMFSGQSYSIEIYRS